MFIRRKHGKSYRTTSQEKSFEERKTSSKQEKQIWETLLGEEKLIPKYFLKEKTMESFKNYLSEKEKKPKNYVIKMDHEETFFLLDSEGKEIKKSDSKRELEKYAKEHGYNVIYFNENRMQEIKS